MSSVQMPQKLSNLQLELLKIYSFDIDNQQLLEIKSILSKYFAEKVSKSMDALFEEKSWGKDKIQEWYEEHMRTKK